MKKIILLFSLILLSQNLFSESRTVSVMYFDNTTKNADYEWFKKGLADMVITDLSQSSKIKVVERENLEKVIKEQQLQLAGVVSDKDAVELGELLQAKTLIYGSFVIQGDQIRIDAKITDVESGKIEKSMKVEGKTSDIFALQQDFSRRLFLHLVLEPVSGAAEPESLQLDAVKNYYEGLDLMDKGSIDQAMEKFKKSSKIDPLYLRPQKSMEEGYKFLKDFKKLRYQREIKKLYEEAAAIQKRLKEKPFRTYGELFMGVNWAGMTEEEKAEFQLKATPYMKGDTPVQAYWNLQNTLGEIGDLSEEYFEDTNTLKVMRQEIIKISLKAKKLYKKDPFLPEVIYQELMAHYWLEDYKEAKKVAEDLMLNYPDYRMMWAIEDFYEKSLEELEKR